MATKIAAGRRSVRSAQAPGFHAQAESRTEKMTVAEMDGHCKLRVADMFHRFAHNRRTQAFVSPLSPGSFAGYDPAQKRNDMIHADIRLLRGPISYFRIINES